MKTNNGIIPELSIESKPENVRVKYQFQKQSRLLTKDQYQRVFNNARKLPSDMCLALYGANSFDHARLGLIVAKKNIRDAVRRNRFKRIVRESFRRAQKQLDAVDIVIIAQRKADTVSNEEIRLCLANFWKKLIGVQKKV